MYEIATHWRVYRRSQDERWAATRKTQVAAAGHDLLTLDSSAACPQQEFYKRNAYTDVTLLSYGVVCNKVYSQG